MKKILTIILILAFAAPALASDTRLRKYGVQTTIDFCLHITDATVGAVTVNNAVCADTGSADDSDVQIMKDEGAPTDTTNCFVDEGNCYSVVLTATEMQAERIHMLIEDRTGTKVWADKSIDIETYGNASAMHAFDLDTATQSVSIGANGINDTSYSLPQLTAESGTTLTLAASAVAVDDQFNNGFALDVYDNFTKALKARSCIVDSTNTGETVVTAEDISGLIVSVGVSADYYTIKSDGGCLLQKATVEPAACLTATANPLDQINFLATGQRNKIVQNASNFILYKDDGSTALCTKAVTPGSTFTLGEGS